MIFPQAVGKAAPPLAEEAKLLEILLTELRATGTVTVHHSGALDLPRGGLESMPAALARCEGLARTAQVHVLIIASEPLALESNSQSYRDSS